MIYLMEPSTNHICRNIPNFSTQYGSGHVLLFSPATTLALMAATSSGMSTWRLFSKSVQSQYASSAWGIAWRNCLARRLPVERRSAYPVLLMLITDPKPIGLQRFNQPKQSLRVSHQCHSSVPSMPPSMPQHHLRCIWCLWVEPIPILFNSFTFCSTSDLLIVGGKRCMTLFFMALLVEFGNECMSSPC